MMERHHPDLFDQAHALIEPVLRELGFSLAEEHYHRRSFGSAFAVYTRRGGELRVIWDGREEASSADHVARTLIEKRIDWVALRCARWEEIPQLADELNARFGSDGVT